MAELASTISSLLIKELRNTAMNRIRELMGFSSQDTEEIKESLSTANMVLRDVDVKWDHLSFQHREFIRKLNGAVYDADDLFDEFVTLGSSARSSRRMSREVKVVKKMLSDILADRRIFQEIVNIEPIRMRRDETISYVDASSVIGRDKDKESIIDMLLHGGPTHVGFLSIVGVGGLGKTALAQLVFNDERIKHEFDDRLWVSVSDLYKEQFDLKTIICKILESATGRKYNADNSTMELVQTQFMERVERGRYFLVLDDVWNEDHVKWLDLKRFLMVGQRGSKVLVTTRSMRTASIIGDRLYDHAYLLQRLSKEDSWRLFQKLALVTSLEEETRRYEFVEIGKNVVDKCYCNPLVIQVVGNYLFGQSINKWQLLERSGLAKIDEIQNKILPVLKLSYYNFEPSTRSCFRYCSIFTKEVRIRKEKIISLWMAQGYTALEDDAEQVFLNLLNRCIFEDVVRDEYGDVESFRINDLMHDVAQEVGQEEVCITTSNVNCLGNHIRHLHHVGDELLDISLYSKKIRSYVSGCERIIDKQIDNWMLLRVLDLSRCNVKVLPDSIGKLLHLRYLDLSHNKNLKLLCDPITKLYNLQTLGLDNCDNLTCMPLGMDKLINLRVLPLFVVGNRFSSERQISEGVIQDLEALSEIRGKIFIKIGTNYRTVGEETDNSGGVLKSMEFLKEIRIEFKDGTTCAYNPEAVLDKLEPPANIKGIILHSYKGTRIGSWGRADHNWAISFPHLVHIVIWKCRNLQQMPLLSKLLSLKTLSFFCLDSLEYIENATSSDAEGAEFFPSLESLKIMWMERLKGWWKKDDVADDWGLRLRFPRLLYLKIYKCPNFISFAPCQSSDNMANHEFPRLCSSKIANCPNMAFNLNCPTVEMLELRDIGERLHITCGNTEDEGKWIHMEVDRVIHLKPVNTNSLARLCIHGDSVVESLLEVEDAFQGCSSSLRELEIRYCANLGELTGLKHLTALEELKLLGNNKLSITGDDEVPWNLFHQTLLHLKFDALPEMRSLPKGIQCFTSLQILEFRWCENLEELPQWMSCLLSLKSLSIIHCPRIRFLPDAMKELTSLKNLSIQHGCPILFTRCQNPNGEDFPKIQHISNISIG